MKRRKLTALLMAALMLASVTACGGAPAASQEAEPPDLTGVWEQANDAGNGYIQKAQIQGDVMEVYWIDSDTDTEALYWAGSFTPPETAEEPYTWTSENDTEKTGYAIMASTSDTKDFTYNAGKISYEVSIQGVSWTVELKKVEGAVPDIDTGDSSADSSEAVTEQPDAEPAETAYEVGDTWTVDGQWELTVTGVYQVEPGPYDEDPPAVIYQIDYTYTNLGFDNGTSGLNLNLLLGSIVDSEGMMGDAHDYIEYPDDVPQGATSEVSVSVGLDHPGTFTIDFTMFDDQRNLHDALFRLEPSEAPVTTEEEPAQPPQITEGEPAQTGGTLTVGEMSLTLPDYAAYSETEAGTSWRVELDPGVRQFTIVLADMSSFDAENADIWNQMMVAAVLDNCDEVSSQDSYTVTVAGETAQMALCEVTLNGVPQTFIVTALMHNGTQYVFTYAQAQGATGDSTDFMEILNSAAFTA